MSEDMKELEQKISEAEKTMLQAKEVYEATIEKLAVLPEQRDRIRRGLDGGRVTLDQEFDDYCTEDDYYQPVVEDFEAEEYAHEWAEERNIRLISFEGKGFDGGFEPKHRGWR